MLDEASDVDGASVPNGPVEHLAALRGAGEEEDSDPYTQTTGYRSTSRPSTLALRRQASQAGAAPLQRTLRVRPEVVCRVKKTPDGRYRGVAYKHRKLSRKEQLVSALHCKLERRARTSTLPDRVHVYNLAPLVGAVPSHTFLVDQKKEGEVSLSSPRLVGTNTRRSATFLSNSLGI